MNRFRAVSVDDEPGAHAALGVLLKDIADFELAATYTSPKLAVSALAQMRCDLLFLDVAMPEMDGLELLRRLPQPPVTILLTARVEHALAAFDLGVRDYLLKPVSPQRLQRSLDHIRPLLQATAGAAGSAPARLSIKCGVAHRLVDPSRVARVEAEGNFSVVHAADGRIFASETMKELQYRFAPFGFMRIHKSHLVNVHCVASIAPGEIRLLDGLILPLGRTYRDAVQERMR